MGVRCIYCGKNTVEVVKTFGEIKGKKLLRPKARRKVIYRCYSCKKHSVDYDLSSVDDKNGVQKTIQDSK